MSEDFEHYRRQFYQEALDILDTANDNLLKAEADPENRELLNAIFRGIHTIKGSAGTFGLDAISEFAHHLEALLSALRDGICTLSAEITDAVLHGMDVLAAMVEGHKQNILIAPDPAVIAEIKHLLPSPEGQKPADSPLSASSREAGAAPLPVDVPEQFAGLVRQGLRVFKIGIHYTDEIHANGYDQLIFMKNLKEACSGYKATSLREDIPELSSFNPLSLYLHPTIFAATALCREQLIDLAFDPALISVEEIGRPGADASTPGLTLSIANLDPQVLQEFIVSSQESLSALEQATLAFEREGSVSALNEIFRTVHNIKGDANYVGLSDLVPFAHDLESILEGLKSGLFRPTAQTADIILSSIDGLKTVVTALSQGLRDIPLPGIAGVIHTHLAFMLRKQTDETTTAPAASMCELPESFFEQIRQYRDILSSLIPLDFNVEKTVRIVGRTLKGICVSSAYVKCDTLVSMAQKALNEFERKDYASLSETVTELLSFIRGMTEERKRIGEMLVEEGKIASGDVTDALAEQRTIGQILVEQGKVSSEDIQAVVRKQDLMEMGRQLRPDVEPQGEIRTMRVDENKIERFANLLGEMVIARNTYEYIIGQLVSTDLASSDTLKPLKENLHLFSRVTTEMQTGIMAMRMVPIKSIFMKFQRVVRDIGRKQNKEIDLLFHGEETEVDKKVADMLSEPLVHMVRNSCDHGIETMVQRRKAGKPDRGTIILNATQEGRNILIKIIDDGQGLDRNKIYHKALKMGLNPCAPDDDGIFQYIFAPGLSTKTEVSDVSGRGVGMDVVNSSIKMLGGDISINSEAGKGTEITLAIPMAIGISTALTISAGRNEYAIPFDYVLETIKVQPEMLHFANGRQVFHYRGKVVAVEHLADLLGSAGGGRIEIPGGGPETPAEVIPLVMLKTTRGMLGVIVDKLGRNLEIAIKPVPSQLAFIQVVSGVSIMGDGKVLMVLNPEKLFIHTALSEKCAVAA